MAAGTCIFPLDFPICFKGFIPTPPPEPKTFIDIDFSQRFDAGDGNFLFDIALGEDGDLLTVNSFDTALKMSLFCQRRATPAEEGVPELRRGWIGNEANDVEGFEMGSKLWLLMQSRLDQNVLNEAVDYTKQCLQWFVDDKLLKSLDVFGTRTIDKITLKITLFRFNGRTDTFFFNLWNNTGTLTRGT